MTKKCTKCLNHKDLSEFGTRLRNSDGKRGRCKDCEKIDRELYLSTDEGELRRQAASKKWYAKNRESQIERNKVWKENNKEYRIAYSRKQNLKRYGITVEKYEEMLCEQNNKCKICGTNKPHQRWERFSVDHCHKTNIVRGLLCGSCNLGIGQFNDDVHRLSRAIEYIKNNGEII